MGSKIQPTLNKIVRVNLKYLLPNLILAVILYAVLIYAFLDVMKKKDQVASTPIKQLEVDKQEKVIEVDRTQLRFEQIHKDSFYEEK